MERGALEVSNLKNNLVQFREISSYESLTLIFPFLTELV